MGTKTRTTGTPIFIHARNPNSPEVDSRLSKAPMKMMFGGVPIGVPMPPMFAAYAMPSRRGTASRRSLAPLMTARATGNIIKVVAVLEIHIDKAAVAIMKAKITLRGPRPKIRDTPLTTPMATLRWAPVHSMARLSMKPHIRSRISLSP